MGLGSTKIPLNFETTVALWITNSPRNTEDVGSIPSTGRYIVARMTTKNGGPLSLGPIPISRLKNLKHSGKCSSLWASVFQLEECQ